MDASEIYLRRISAKEIWIGLKGDEFIFPFAEVQQNCQEETATSENPLQGRKILQEVKVSEEKFKAKRKHVNQQI